MVDVKKKLKRMLEISLDKFLLGGIQKQECLNAIIATRMLAIKNIEETLRIRKIIKYSNRKLRKANVGQEITYEVKTPLNDVLVNLNDERVYLGALIKLFMNKWQELGATYEEFLNICNLNKEQVDEETSQYIYGQNYFESLMITYLDYKDTGLFIELTPNAPLTMLAKDYLFYTLTKTKIGEKAGRIAIKKVFPKLTMYHKVIDSIGNEFLISEDGTETIPLG